MEVSKIFKRIVMGIVTLAIMGMMVLPEVALAKRGDDKRPEPIVETETESEVEFD
jgi:hypothetical protein